MRRALRPLVAALIAFAALAVTGITPARAAQTSVGVVNISGVICETSVSILESAIGTAQSNQYQAVVVVLNSDGGQESAMREMISAISKAPVPVVVDVPAGGWADSAAFFVAESSDFLVVAPNATVGAQHAVAFAGPATSDGVAALSIEKNPGDFASALAAANGRDGQWASIAARQGSAFSGDQARVRGMVNAVAIDVNGALVAANDLS